MTYDNYILLPISCIALLFAIKAYKKDRWMGAFAITGTLGGLAVFIVRLLEDIYPESEATIKSIAMIPIWFLGIMLMCLSLVNALRLRKKPEHRAHMNFVLCLFVFTLIFVVVMLILLQLGIFGE